MPELNGLEATRQILRAVPQTEVLILTIHASEQLMRDVLEVGARGYVLKSDAARDLVNAVESLLQHKPFLTCKASEMVLEGYLNSSTRADRGAPGHSPLSPRQREVAQLLAEGNSNKEVAAFLGISPKTAEAHRASLMHKLGLRSATELVRYAIRNKIIEP
jgi:DNA-binding NarL/FixJ family response regulator